MQAKMRLSCNMGSLWANLAPCGAVSTLALAISPKAGSQM
jgi:hypothetical protein